MFQLIPFFALLAVSSALYTPKVYLSDFDERIIGGNEVRKNSYPFMVRIAGTKQDGSGYLCGGTLIHEHYVVTAAHCVYNSKNPVTKVRLYFGDHHLWNFESTESYMDISMIYIRRHGGYNERTIVNDIAIIKVPKKAPISAHVQPICVASAATVSRHQIGTAMGWGLTKNWQHGGQISEVLKEVNLPIMPNSECRLFGGFNPEAMICAGNTKGIEAAVCSGDSGGPFVVNAGQLALTGIASFVSGAGCVAVGYGVVFVRVSNYIQWLKGFMGSDLCVV